MKFKAENFKDMPLPEGQSVERYVLIINATICLFMEVGLAAATMDKVAARAGVAKQTVYSYFQSKENLFAKVIEVVSNSTLSFDDAQKEAGNDPVSEISFLSKRFFHLVTSEEAIIMHRMLADPNQQNAEMAKTFYEVGPKVGLNGFADVIKKWADKGKITIVDEPMVAARTLLSMLKGIYYMELTLGIRSKISDDEIEAHLKTCVDQFFRLYPLTDKK